MWSFWKMLLLSRRISLATSVSMLLSHKRNVTYSAPIVEQQPDLGLLGGGRSLERILLDEVADRRQRAIDGFVQPAVHAQRRRQASRADGGPALVIAGDDRWRGRGSGAGEGERRIRVRSILAGGGGRSGERGQANTGQKATKIVDRHSFDHTG